MIYTQNQKVKVKYVGKNTPYLPSYATEGSSGLDLRADISKEIVLPANNGRLLVPTGICFDFPDMYEAQVRPRSGLALKYGITVLNAPGTIDNDYTGDIKVLLINTDSRDFIIQPFQKIAQIIILKYVKIHLVDSSDFKDTGRGGNGFGSTDGQSL
ncbi:MAG: deoxyuridine 5'-triphosphate nucleotidohydrolase [Candidatus Xenolissoclinum pacificiensis L6]|uniref:Deoxyuridine 5'-triphosphate nucleotidohydrolase n=1 Tax=Candidatus Xenolissoclinum pacificiensis L6 TaxID=1401685 RepID=W2V1U7_9RICK|nr:MAG: deoxyuridine 5'-triphosphate nucleotidohydrolase [Candidatus Xenolissoclinum pacificiensis L6]